MAEETITTEQVTQDTQTQEAAAKKTAEEMYGYEDPGRATKETNAGDDHSAGEDAAAKAEAVALAARAKELGLSEKAIKGLGGDLKTVVERMTAAAPAAKAKEPEVKRAEPPKVEAFKKLDLTPVLGKREDWDDKTLKLFDAISEHVNALNDHYAQAATKQAAEVQAAQDALDGVSREQFTDMLDRSIAALGEGYEKLFGKGGATALAKDSVHWKNRDALTEEIDVIEAGRETLGIPALPFGQTFQKAIKSAFPNETQAIARTEISKSIKPKGRVNRPTQRQGFDQSGQPGREKALAACRTKLAEITG